MKFKILEVNQEWHIDGMKTIKAEAQDENNTIVEISYKANDLVDFNAKSLSVLLNNAYLKQEIIKSPKVGDIV